jgi:hypothetical protein
MKGGLWDHWLSAYISLPLLGNGMINTFPRQFSFVIPFYLQSVLVHSGQGVYSATNRNEYHEHKDNNVLGSKVRRVRWADNLTSLCEPID